MNLIPNIIKNKINKAFNTLYAIIMLLVSLISFLALISFNINDDSFLAQSSFQSTNLFGDFGSYYASFVIYTFGIMGFGLAIFFFIYGFFILKKKSLRYFFIRLLLILTSLTLIPQIFFFHELQWVIWDEIPTWGTLSKNLYSYHQSNIVSYILSTAGLLIFLSSQNLLNFKIISEFKIPHFSNNYKKNKTTINRKEPIIANNVGGYETDIKEIKKDIKIKNTDNDLGYNAPSLEVLNEQETNIKDNSDKSFLEKNSKLLEEVFANFNVEVRVINTREGPVITLYEILPSPGIKINTIINLSGDVSRSMGVGAVRISQIFGTQYLGVEIPNEKRAMITIKELLKNKDFRNSAHKIPLCIGKNISGAIEVIDLSKAPHLLIAGTTGSGKSVFINTLLASLLYKFSPKELRLILIDPKMLELSVYNDIAHLLTPVVTEPKKAIVALKWVCKEMERRYTLMNEEGTRSLEGYNQKTIEKLPFIVVVIDEMADLMMTAGKEVEHYVQRLAQMARACGIHLVTATQRPSVDIITGSIKANFPSRISFQVASKYDSRTVLGEIGAEQLLGNGDMLMSKNGSELGRYQSAFISDNEVAALISQIKKNNKVQYLDELNAVIQSNNDVNENLSDEDEELISKSINLIKTSQKASTSFLQRNFQIGYNKAARIMETLEQRGVVSEPNHAGKREILINIEH